MKQRRGQRLQGDWLAPDLPLLIPEQRLVFCYRGKKEERAYSPDKTFSCSANAAASEEAGEVKKKRGESLNGLFNRTHPLCMAARRLFLSLLLSGVTAKCPGVTAGTPDLSDWISAISGQCA